MTTLRIYFLFFCLTGLITGTRAQNPAIDSLKKILENNPADSQRINLLTALFNEWEFTDTTQAKKYALELIRLGKKKHSPTATAEGYVSLAYLADDVGKYKKALVNYRKALAIYKKAKNQKGMASVMGGMGIIYRYLGNYPMALEYYFAALKISETLKSKKDMARHYGNIGVVFSDINDSAKAAFYYKKSLALNIELKNKHSTGIWQGNIAVLFMEQHKYEKAMHYYTLSYEAAKTENDERAMAINLGNIGLVFKQINKPDSALKCLERALAINEKIDNKLFITLNLTNLGNAYTELKDYKKAEMYLVRGLAVAKEINSKSDIKQAYTCLEALYTQTKRPQKALESYRMFCLYKDSLINEERSRELTRHELTYEFEKHKSELKAKQLHINEKALADREKQFMLLLFIGAVAFIVSIIAVIIFRSLKNAKKQNKVIESQKRIIEEKQKEVIDSIRYSRRIQFALLKGEKYVDRSLTRLNKKSN